MGVSKRKRDLDNDYEGWSLTMPTAPVPGSSSIPITLDLPEKPAKKPRKKKLKDPNAPEPEKRGAIFKKKCPQNILDRVERVMSQRFFMVDRRRVAGQLREEFSVLGSTGNVYTVVIDRKPSCTCPDALKGNHCKHILFIFLKVLQVTQASGYWYQKALLTNELETIFSEAPPAPGSVAHTRVREAYAKATSSSLSTASESNAGKKRIPGPEDDCPICYEKMHDVKESGLTFCEECGNALHQGCFQEWSKSAAARQNLTCVYCRAKWPLPAVGGRGGGGARTTAEGYLNLAGVAGLSTVRDTSTYHQGPRRGQRYYGYQDYYD